MYIQKINIITAIVLYSHKIIMRQSINMANNIKADTLCFTGYNS